MEQCAKLFIFGIFLEKNTFKFYSLVWYMNWGTLSLILYRWIAFLMFKNSVPIKMEELKHCKM